MRNLAGESDCDVFIRDELRLAQIAVIEGPRSTHEVATRVTGKLGLFTFTRAWSYWIAEGPMPLNVAEEMYEDPVGRTTVRAGGDCACRPPVTWASFLDADGKELFGDDQEGSQELALRRIVALGILPQESYNAFRFVREAGVQSRSKQAPVLRQMCTRAVINTFHIDSQDGLRLFGSACRKVIE